MTRTILKTFLATLLISTLAASAHAKDPFNQLQDLVGAKGLRTKGPVVKQSMHLEFLALSGNHLIAIHESEVVPVRVVGFGSGHVQWEMGGLNYEITNYPFGNNHKPVGGKVRNAAGLSQKFTLYSKKTPALKKGQTTSRGRWTGELAFPGSSIINFGIQVANVSWNFENCSNGVAYMHVNYQGAPSQPSSLMHCDGMVENGDYYASFFHWDDITGEIHFVTINGDITPDGEVFQGQATAFNLYDGSNSEGKFLLFRPQSLSL